MVIERHITLDKNMEGEDHKASMEPWEFKDLVHKIRKLEVGLGNGIKRCMSSELNIRDVIRIGSLTKEDIPKNHFLQWSQLDLMDD